jgi:hypothetical protein
MEVWLTPFGFMQFKSQLDRCIFNLYFPNYEKLKYCVETFTPYGQTLCMCIGFYFDTYQAKINSVQDYRESSLEAHYYVYPPDLHSV